MARREETREQWLRRIARESARERVRRARAAVKKAIADRRAAGRRARAVCQQARINTREWIARARLELREEIARLRAQLNAAIEEKRAKVRKCCGADRAEVRAQGDEKIAAARAELAALMRDRDVEKIWGRADTLKRHGRKARAQRVRESAAHHESEVEANLSPDELIVWRRVKKQIPHGTPKISRTEQFHKWVHNHSADVARILSEEAEREVERAIRAEERERAELRDLRKATAKRAAEVIRRELDAVPF